MRREAQAVWRGGLYAGEGRVLTPSKGLEAFRYSFDLSIGDSVTSPCELLAASIASCMSTMVAVEMAKAGLTPKTVETHAAVTLENLADRWQISGVALEINAHSIESDCFRFEKAVKAAGENCPISNALNLRVECKTRLIPSFAETPV